MHSLKFKLISAHFLSSRPPNIFVRKWPCADKSFDNNALQRKAVICTARTHTNAHSRPYTLYPTSPPPPTLSLYLWFCLQKINAIETETQFIFFYIFICGRVFLFIHRHYISPYSLWLSPALNYLRLPNPVFFHILSSSTSAYCITKSGQFYNGNIIFIQ